MRDIGWKEIWNGKRNVKNSFEMREEGCAEVVDIGLEKNGRTKEI